MKKIWNYLKIHLREDFNKGYYLTVAVFLTISLALNYRYDFEDDYLENLTGLTKFVAYFLFYLVAYLVSVLSYVYFGKQKGIINSRTFWVKGLFLIGIVSLDSSLPFLDNWIRTLFHPQMQYWAYKVGANLISFVTVFFPVVVLYYSMDSREKHLYGLFHLRFDRSALLYHAADHVSAHCWRIL